MRNRIKEQYWLFFGALYEHISEASDWDSIDSAEKARRLEQALRAQCDKYGRPRESEGGSLFEDAIACLESPD